MAREKSDIIVNIGEIRSDRNNGRGSYCGGECVDCGVKFPTETQKVVDIYDVCWTCYNKADDPKVNRMISLIKELERWNIMEARQEQR